MADVDPEAHQTAMNPLDKPHTSCPYTGPERRHFLRRTVQVPIELQLEDSSISFFAETTDLSRNGCYISRARPLPVGLKVHARLWLNAAEVQVSGRIVTAIPSSATALCSLRWQSGASKSSAPTWPP